MTNTSTSESMETDAAGSRVPAASRAVTVLNEVASSGPGTLSDLSRRTHIPKSSLLYICQALVDERLLANEPNGRFSLGLGILELADAYKRQPPRLTALGVTVQNLDNPFFHVETGAIRQAASAQETSVDVQTANQSVQRQVGQIRRFIAEGCEAIIVDAVDSLGVAEVISEARRAGIVVVAVNVGASGAQATVTTDNLQAGQLVASAIDRDLGGVGSVAVVDGLHVTAVRDRLVGFRSAFRDSPRIQVAPNTPGDHSRVGGYKAAVAIFDKLRPDAVFAINDPTALGVADYCEEFGISTPIYSVDGSAAAVAVIAAGGPITATAAQDPAELGRRAFSAAALLRAGATTVPAEQHLPTRLIEASNAKDYEAWA